MSMADDEFVFKDDLLQFIHLQAQFIEDEAEKEANRESEYPIRALALDSIEDLRGTGLLGRVTERASEI